MIDKELSYSKLNQLLSYGNPLGDIDEIELRICLYEMLVEKTIVIDEQRRYTVDVVESETD